MTEFASPRIAPEDERDSLSAHTAKWREGQALSALAHARVMSVIERLYEPARWWIPEDWDSDARIAAAIGRLHKTSSPGFPMCVDMPSNSCVIDYYGIDGLIHLVRERLAAYRARSVDLHPFRVFIKREPHKASKVAEKRWRLIWAVPLLDQLIDELLYGPSMQQEIDNWAIIPSKPGFSFVHGDAHLMHQYAPNPEATDWIGLDKSGWDWTVRGSDHLHDVEFRERRCNNPQPDFFELMRIRAYMHAWAPLATSDGYVYERIRLGILPSGVKKTLSFNSFKQVYNKVAYVLSTGQDYNWHTHAIYAQGDDSVERMHGLDADAYVEFLTRLGYTPQDLEKGKFSDLLFCSHRWKLVDGRQYGVGHQYVFTPDAWERHDWKLGHIERNSEVFVEKLFSYCIEYAWDDDKFPKLYAKLMEVAQPGSPYRWSVSRFREMHFADFAPAAKQVFRHLN